MKTRARMIMALCVFSAFVAVLLGWFRIRSKTPDDMIHIVSETEAPNQFEAEYRTHQPFHVSITHVNSDKKEVVVDLPARYDWIHGDYYFILRVDCSNSLSIDANGEIVEVPIWCGMPASRARFGTGGVLINGRRLGGGDLRRSICVIDLASFEAEGEIKERFWVHLYLDKDKDRIKLH